MDKYQLSEADAKKLAHNFTYHKPKDDQPERYESIRATGLVLAKKMCALCPPGRELSLALTHLEESIHWANASIARNE